jgi:redox-sensitive bicupin YhaK (pirin superfamily)
VHFLQIWVIPDRDGITPRYAQKTFPAGDKRGRLLLVGSSDGRDGSVVIHQDVELLASILAPGEEVTGALLPRRKAGCRWSAARSTSMVAPLSAGDGAAIEDEPEARDHRQAATRASCCCSIS